MVVLYIRWTSGDAVKIDGGNMICSTRFLGTKVRASKYLGLEILDRVSSDIVNCVARRHARGAMQTIVAGLRTAESDNLGSLSRKSPVDLLLGSAEARDVLPVPRRGWVVMAGGRRSPDHWRSSVVDRLL